MCPRTIFIHSRQLLCWLDCHLLLLRFTGPFLDNNLYCYISTMGPARDMTSPLAPRSRRATSAAPPSIEASPPSSRRPSQAMGPPSIPFNQNTHPDSPIVVTADSGGAGTGKCPYTGLSPVLRQSGPLRHPKPLTQVDLHSMLEKEQEAIVSHVHGPSSRHTKRHR